MKNLDWRSIILTVPLDESDGAVDEDMLVRECSGNLLHNYVNALPVAEEGDPLVCNCSALGSIEKPVNKRLDVKRLFTTQTSVIQREKSARDVVSHQETAGAISDLASSIAVG